MQYLLSSLIISFLTAITTAQQLIPSNLPSCAAQCTVLQQAQTGCTPAGGAPVTGQAQYQSCFCQSALLTQLYSDNTVQVCTTCSQSDMSTIQNWYKDYCGRGGAPVQGNGNQNQDQNNQNGQQTSTSTTSTQRPTQSPTRTANGNNQGVTQSENADDGRPWMSTHWKWVLMLIIIFFGLIAVAVGGWFFHRRYHRKREAQWAQAPAMQPDINTWGPGQSVHDLGLAGSAAVNEKGKSREQVQVQQQGSGVQKPLPAVKKEARKSGRFF